MYNITSTFVLFIFLQFLCTVAATQCSSDDSAQGITTSPQNMQRCRIRSVGNYANYTQIYIAASSEMINTTGSGSISRHVMLTKEGAPEAEWLVENFTSYIKLKNIKYNEYLTNEVDPPMFTRLVTMRHFTDCDSHLAFVAVPVGNGKVFLLHKKTGKYFNWEGAGNNVLLSDGFLEWYLQCDD